MTSLKLVKVLLIILIVIMQAQLVSCRPAFEPKRGHWTNRELVDQKNSLRKSITDQITEYEIFDAITRMFLEKFKTLNNKDDKNSGRSHQ